MAVTYEGHVENGQIILDENVTLPEHAKVFIVLPENSGPGTVRIMSPRLMHAKDAPDFKKLVIERISDA